MTWTLILVLLSGNGFYETHEIPARSLESCLAMIQDAAIGIGSGDIPNPIVGLNCRIKENAS